MILYVNGDSHSAGAEALNSCSFANDDYRYQHLGRKPHPDNLEVCFGNLISKKLGFELHMDAESASSNSRIIRTTKEYLIHNIPSLILIGWASWERQEWLYDNIYWQVNGGGMGHDWPQYIKDRYPEYVLNINFIKEMNKAHTEIYNFHLFLNNKNIPHLFFNTFMDFYEILHADRLEWGDSYISPYDKNMTYWKWLTNNGFKSLSTYHFKADAHEKWAEFLIPHLTKLL